MRCKTHRTYKGVKPPRVLCETCWAIYLGMCETCVNAGCQCSDGYNEDDPDGYVLEISDRGTRRIG